MCGRFTLRTPMSVLVKQFSLFQEDDLDEAFITPRYNIAPTQNVAIVRGAAEGGKRHLELARWGLIPFWAKDASIGHKMVNARGEAVAEKPAFRQAFLKRRCLVLADGYYEWKKMPDGKQPFHIHLKDDSPMAFAGLWEFWDKGEAPIESCTIITTQSNELTSDVHDRMPVILHAHELEVWLSDTNDKAALLELIRPFESEPMAMDEVSRYVNNVKHQGPECLSLSDA